MKKGENNRMQERCERAEESARESEAKYATLVEHSNDGIIIVQDGRIIFANRKMLELTDYSMSEIFGKSFTDFVALKYEQQIDEYHRLRTPGKESSESYEAEIVRKDGKSIEVEVNTYRIDYQGKPASIAVIHDYTERNKNWGKLLERETQLKFIYDNVSDIIFVIDIDAERNYRFLSVNSEFLENTGLREEQVVGKLIQDVMKEPAFSTIVQKHEEAVQTKHKVRWEDTFNFPSGKKYGEITIAPVFSKNGICTHFIGTAHDITERKKAEIDLSEYNDQLENLVKKRTDELAQKNRELEKNNLRLQEVDRLKSVFLASMSHELRTPLNSIIGFTGIMLQGLAGPINDEQKKQLTMVKNNAAHLLALINDILDMSKIEAGKLDVSTEEFRFNDIALEVIESFSNAVKEKEIALIFDISSEIYLKSDRRRIKQVLLNLVSNAIKFTEKGCIRLVARVNDQLFECNVIDTGKGIASEHINRLFQPFQQVDYSLIKKYQGTGLGLYLCKRMLDILGGTISVESEPEKGSTFTFKIPLKRDLEVGK